jgi:hypothetical protein
MFLADPSVGSMDSSACGSCSVVSDRMEKKKETRLKKGRMKINESMRNKGIGRSRH